MEAEALRDCKGQVGVELARGLLLSCKVPRPPRQLTCTHTHAHAHACMHTHTITETSVGAQNFLRGPETGPPLNTGNPAPPPEGLLPVHSPSHTGSHLNTYPALPKSSRPSPTICHPLSPLKPRPQRAVSLLGSACYCIFFLSLSNLRAPYPCSESPTHESCV